MEGRNVKTKGRLLHQALIQQREQGVVERGAQGLVGHSHDRYRLRTEHVCVHASCCHTPFIKYGYLIKYASLFSLPCQTLKFIFHATRPRQSPKYSNTSGEAKWKQIRFDYIFTKRTHPNKRQWPYRHILRVSYSYYIKRKRESNCLKTHSNQPLLHYYRE